MRERDRERRRGGREGEREIEAEKLTIIIADHHGSTSVLSKLS